MRIATFNVENLDDAPVPEGEEWKVAAFEDRVPLLRSQLARLDADILCLQEVHGQKTGTARANDRSLRALDTLLQGTGYDTYARATTVTSDGDPYAFRNLVTLVRPGLTLEAFDQFKEKYADPPVYDLQMDSPDAGPKKIGWERPVLHSQVRLADGRLLHVLNVHFKSKNPTDIKGGMVDSYTWKSAGAWAEGFFISSMKRVGAAIEVRKFIDTLIDADPEALIVLCGDLNAEPHEVPVQALCGELGDTQNPALGAYVMYPCAHSVPEDKRFTLYHHGKKNLLDHMLMSRGMLQHFSTADIHNELVRDESVSFATDARYPASDHAPFIGIFTMPGAMA